MKQYQSFTASWRLVLGFYLSFMGDLGLTYGLDLLD